MSSKELVSKAMSVVTCPRCGASNTATARFCSTCGTSLVTVPAPTPPAMGYAPPPAAQQYYPYQYPANYWEVARTNKVNNTLTGLLLLVIGVLIAWIPFAGFIGGIVGFIGGILVLVGREPFGADHVRNATLALIFFVVGIAVTIFGFFYALAYGISSGLGVSVVGLFGRQRRILDTILRHWSTPLHRLPRRHTGRTLRDSILPGTRKNRSSRNTPTNETTRARKTTLVENFLKHPKNRPLD